MEKPFVLVADDNEATCTLMTALLRAEYEVDIATDGGEAIEKLKHRSYAAILLDLRMPVIDGYGVLDHLRTERPDLLQHVLIVTAALSAPELKRLDGYAVCGVIPKPFEVDSLFTAVRQCAGDHLSQFTRGPLISGGMLLLIAEVLRRV